MYREHWLNIIRYCKKYLWLLIFPLIRGLRSFSFFKFTAENFKNWISGSSYDLLIMLFIIGYGYLQWYYSRYTFDSSKIIHQNGIFHKKKCTISSSSIVSIIAEKPFYLIPFRAVRLYVDTSSGNISNTDMRLLMKQCDYEKIKETMPVFKKTKDTPPEEKPKLFSVILFSALFSSSLSGTIYVVAFLFQGGKNALNVIQEAAIQQKVNDISYDLSSKLKIVPPVIIAIVFTVITMWFISFISNCFRYWNFKIIKRDRNIKIDYGLFTKRYYYIDSSKINYTDMRQNMLMKIKALDIMSITASCPGYGNKSTQIPVFIPILSKSRVRKTLSIIMPDKIILKNRFKSKPKFFWQFLWQPCISMAVVLAVCITAYFNVDILKQFILFILIMVEIPLVWLAAVRTVDVFSNGVGIKKGQICLRYCKGFTFHTILADCNKIVRIRTSQSLLQKRIGVCNMYFYFESRNPKKHKIIGITEEDAQKIISLTAIKKGEK